ncbi:hypothetical protein L7F22_064074 [Adiantum nelumboides]|nr:hypothetical protein [Adiantum nelumboides]
MYAMVATRPDIAFAVGVLSRYMANASKKHWEAVKHIFWYLKGMVSKHLHFENSDASIVGYVNADYVGCVDNRRSTSGYGATVSWRSSFQNCTSSSTTKAEYVALSDASKEAQMVITIGYKTWH